MIKRKSFIKTALALLLAGSFISLCGTVSAESIYKGEFLKNEYVFYKIDDNFSSEELNNYDFCDFPVGGKTQISFDFLLKADAKGKISVISSEYTEHQQIEVLSLVFETSKTGISVKGINKDGETAQIADSLSEQVTYSLDIQLDFNTDRYNAVLYEGSDRNLLINLENKISLGKNIEPCGFYGLNSSLGENISFSDFRMSRERLAQNIPVIKINKESVSIGSQISQNISTGEEFSVYAAFYSHDDGVLKAVEKAECVFSGADNYTEAFFALSDNFKQNCPVSMFIMSNKTLYPLAKKGEAQIAGGDVLSDSRLLRTGFENDEEYTQSTKVTAGKLPVGWGAQGWAGAEAPFNIDIISNNEDSFAEIKATDSGYMGVVSSYLLLPQNGVSVSCNIKCSSDYTGNYPRIVFLYFGQDNLFVGSDYKLLKNEVSTSWSSHEFYINPSEYPANAAKISVAFCTSSASGSVGGSLYYDSLCIDELVFNMVCESELGWYKYGEEVVYKPQFPLSDSITEIRGIVYNSDGDIVDKVSTSAEIVTENGWRYNPSDSGFYKVIFEAYTADNQKLYEHWNYKAYYDANTGSLTYIDKASHSFYVTSFENKSIEERNKLYGLSIGNYDGKYDLDIADKVGMSFLRLHAFSWNEIEPEDVTADNGKAYNWLKYDKIFDRIRNEGLDFDIIGNVLYTPKWASPSDNESGTLVPEYASYAPTDLGYFTDFVTDLYSRYGDVVDIWEIYNEPHLQGGSVFWRDTTDNYVKLLSNAYETLKNESNSNDTVVMGGIGAKRYLSFYRQFIEKGGWQYTDKLVMHGYDLDPWNYLDINSQLGKEADKGVINTEGHMILFNGSSSNVYYTEKQLGLRMLEEYLRQIKYGLEKITFFQPYDNSIQGEDLMLLDNEISDWDVVAAGLFRKKPYYEPRFAAGALNTLIAMSNSEISYVDEYEAENVNIVQLSSDGEPLYIMWCDNLEKMNMSADLSGIANTAEITDWEGRSVSTDEFTVKADTLYFVEGLSEDSFSYLETAKGQNVYDGKVLYSENESGKKDGNKIFATTSPYSLFDHDTGECIVEEESVLWNKLDLNTGDDLDGSFAVYADEKGIEYMVGLDNTTDISNLQMIIGVDTFANGIWTDVVEITAQISKSETGITKTMAPDIGGDMPSEDYSAKGEEINGAKAFVTDGIDKTFYCVYIPYSQLYPYFYSENGSINFGLSLSGYKASGALASKYYWGSGYSPYRPWNFGTALFGDVSSFDNLIETEIIAEAGEYVTVQILKDNELVYFNQYIAGDDGKCTVSAKLEISGNYMLKTYSNSCGYSEQEFIYKNN